MFTIKSHPVPNFGTRGSHKPIAIVNHITIGKRGSVINTFMNPGGNSSHYLVCRDGEILQFVELRNRAHTNGYVRNPKSPLVRSMGNVNANYYTVTIEHEGYENNGMDGTLTEAQFMASCWLHKHIQTEVEKLYGNRIALNSHQVIAHHQIDSLKGTCPGRNFPWTRLYQELTIADSMTLDAYEEHLAFKKTQNSLGGDAYAFLLRVKNLKKTMEKEGPHSAEARRKLMLLSSAIVDMGLEGTVSAESIVAHIEELEKAAIVDGTWNTDALVLLSIGIQQAKNVGLIA